MKVSKTESPPSTASPAGGATAFPDAGAAREGPGAAATGKAKAVRGGDAMLTHLDESGAARMVDVSGKPPTLREAVAEGFVEMQPRTLELLLAGDLPKGEALGTARIAGIQAAKRCAELIPLCHTLPLEAVEVRFEGAGEQDGLARLRIEASAGVTAKTGVEMEALAAVSVAALTIYDMCKAVDKEMRISGIRLISKTGGRADRAAPPAR